MGETTINKGIPADLVHDVSNIAREEDHTAVGRLGTVADKRIDKIATRIDDRIRGPVSIGKEKVNRTSEILVAPKSKPVGGSKIQNHRRKQQQQRQHRKRKRDIYSYPQLSSKKVKYSLQNIIDQA